MVILNSSSLPQSRLCNRSRSLISIHLSVTILGDVIRIEKQQISRKNEEKKTDQTKATKQTVATRLI